MELKIDRPPKLAILGLSTKELFLSSRIQS